MSGRATQNTGRSGVHAVGYIFEHEFHWYFREQHESDFGIDAQVETVTEDSKPSGKLIALQIKTGASYFIRRGADYVFYGERRHLDYWTNHCLPVFVILHDPDANLTLWQKVEHRLITETETGWSMTIPAINTLTQAAKQYFEAGIAADPEAIRRFRFATDAEWMRRFQKRDVYFVFEIWINKSWNIRTIKVYMDDYEKPEPDHEWEVWIVYGDLHDVMRSFFPWLDYEYADEIQDGSGEVEGHTLYVTLNAHAKRYLKLEEFFREGPPEGTDPEPPLSDEAEFEREMNEASYQDYLQDELERYQENLKRDGGAPLT